MGLLDSMWGIVLPLAHATTIFFFRQFLVSIPDIVDAGRVDGASEYGIFFRLIVLMKPAFRPWRS